MIKFDHLKERGPVRNVRKMVNDLRDEVRALRIANGKNYSVRRTAIGTMLEIKTGTATVAPSDLEIRRFQVIDVKPTYLQCYETSSDGTAFTSTTAYTKVLRPYSTLLNDTSANWTGYTVTTTDTTRNLTRTLTGEDTFRGLRFTWEQRIYPEYVYSSTIAEGDWILAARNIKGFSALDDSAPAQQIIWLDLNVDARHWAVTTPQQVAVCVDGVTKYMRFLASSVGTTP
jgi:hypothetical protein